MSWLKILREAWQVLRTHKIRTALMMIGIVIGTAGLTTAVRMSRAANEAIQERIRGLGLDLLTIRPGSEMPRMPGPAPTDVTTLKLEDAEAIQQQIRGVRRVIRFTNRGRVEVKYGSESMLASIFGTTADWLAIRPADQATRGRFFTEEEEKSVQRVCFIGYNVAALLFKNRDPIGETIRVTNVPCQVIGVMKRFGSGEELHPMDSRIGVPFTTFSQRLFDMDHLTLISVQMDSVDRVEEAAKEITALLAKRHYITPPEKNDFTVATAQQVVQAGASARGSLSLFLGLISGLFLLAGGLVLMNIMLSAVSERTWEVGLRRAVGAEQRDILQQFLAETVLVTVLAGALGLVLAALAAMVLGRLTPLPVAISWSTAAGALIFAAAVGLTFGIYPARQAARLDPAEALRTA